MVRFMSTLCRILRNGSVVDILNAIRQQHFEPRLVNQNGDTLYHVILSNDQLAERDILGIFNILQSQGLDTNIRNKNAKAPVHLAIEKRMMNITKFFIMCREPDSNEPCNQLVKFFVEQEFASMSIQNYNSDSANREKNSANFLEWLIFNGSEVELELEVIHWTINHNLLHILPALLEYADVRHTIHPQQRPLLDLFLHHIYSTRRLWNSSSNKAWYYKYTLRYAAKIVKILLEKEAYIQETLTALVDLTIRENEQMAVVKLLIDRIPLSWNGIYFSNLLYSMISISTAEFSDSEVQLYLQILCNLAMRGIDIDKPNAFGVYPMHAAFEERNVAAISWLIKIGSNIQLLTNNSESLLHLLVKNDNWKYDTDPVLIFYLLFHRECDLNAENNDGQTPLHLAAIHNNITMARRLIEHGAQINFEDCSGRTALHYAVINLDAIHFVELLLQSDDADVNVKDHEGMRPLLAALSVKNSGENKKKMLELLLRNGAHVDIFRDIMANPAIGKRDSSCNIDADSIKILLKYGLQVSVACFASLHSYSWFGKIDVILVQHYMKLHAANLHCPSECKAIFFEKASEFKQYYTDCLGEVETLKTFSIDTQTTLYQFLHVNLNKRCMYTRNTTLKNMIVSPDFEKRFPHYSCLIESAFHQAIARELLLEPAKEALSALTGIKLPGVCVQNIISFLSNHDLVNIIETV